jgi:hypothetical protein
MILLQTMYNMIHGNAQVTADNRFNFDPGYVLDLTKDSKLWVAIYFEIIFKHINHLSF